MSEPIKIVGEWRTMERLTPGVWLVRCKGCNDPFDIGVTALCEIDDANPDREYFGPLEIIEPEPEPTPLPGCRCEITVHESGECYCKCTSGSRWVVIAHGYTRRQAILRHNAAVKAIVEMEKLT